MKNVLLLIPSAFVYLSLLSCEEKKIVNDCSLSYENKIYYLKDNTEIRIKPNLSPNERGLFVSDPDGLAIDSQTGEINISKSAGGQAYQIKFISLDNKYLCQTNLTVSGIDYPDGIYRLSNPNETTVACFYNAIPSNEPPRGANTVYDADQAALRNGLIVDQATGTLNLKESLSKGLFGANPVAGATKDITFSYRINDQSNAALNTITLTVSYYKSVNQIPAAILERLKNKQLYPGGRTDATENHRPPDIIIADE